MYTDDELAETISALQDPSPSERAAMLKALWVWPSEDDRLLSHLDALLGDTSVCVFGSPMRFGEIRWLAAQALFAEIKAKKSSQRVRLEEAIAPLLGDDLLERAHAAGIPCDGSLPEPLSAFAELQRRGKLPITSLDLRL